MKVKLLSDSTILSYPKVGKPEEFMGKVKYSCVLVITNKDDLKALKKAVATVGQEKFGAKFAAGLRTGKISSPFKKTDPEENPGYPEGSTYIRVSRNESLGPPGLVSKVPGPDGKPQALDASRFYPGAIVNAVVVAGAYDKGGSKGVTFFLNHLQFVTDGDRLDNQVNAEDEFEADENAAADLSDMDDDDDVGTEPSNDEDEDEDGDDLSDLM